jgi:hypothetical protein
MNRLLAIATYALALAGLAGVSVASVVAQEATPGTAGATGVTEETLISWTISADQLPEGDVEAVFYRLTLPPAASLPLLAGPFCGCPGEKVKAGVGVEVVEAGTYMLRLDAPLTVVRAGAEDEVAAGTEVTLGPGDVARFPDYAAPGEISSAGGDPVSVVGLAILSQEATGTPVPDLPAEVTARELSSVFPSEWRKLPPGPVTVTLRRLSLPAGAELAPDEPAGLQTIHVDEGMLRVAFIPAGETVPSQPLVFGPGSSTPFQSLMPGTRRVVRNDEDEPATILVLTISSGGEGVGTPVSA